MSISVCKGAVGFKLILYDTEKNNKQKKLTQEKQVRRCVNQEFHKWFSHEFRTAAAGKQHIHHAVQWEENDHTDNDEHFFN